MSKGQAPRAAREEQWWDDEAAEYDDFQETRFAAVYDEVAQRISADLDPRFSVLEMGCGTGILTLEFAPNAHTVKAYDISQRMLSIARRKAAKRQSRNIEFLQGDAYALPHPDGTFDAIVCGYLLDIVEQPERVLSEAHRLLKDDGTLISITDCFQYLKPVGSLQIFALEIVGAIRRMLQHLRLTKWKQRLPKDSELIRLSNSAGFRILESAIVDIGESQQYNLYLKAAKF